MYGFDLIDYKYLLGLGSQIPGAMEVCALVTLARFPES